MINHEAWTLFFACLAFVWHLKKELYLAPLSSVLVHPKHIGIGYVCVLQTHISTFKTPCDVPVPVWQSPWHNMALKNAPMLGVFWPKLLYFDLLLPVVSKLKLVLSSYLCLSYVVTMQVRTLNINHKCQCDTISKAVRRVHFWPFLSNFTWEGFFSWVGHLAYKKPLSAANECHCLLCFVFVTVSL